jgi:acetyl-CoA hydrolase
MGLGSIPDAVLSNLSGHKDLGVHTELFSDGVIDMVEAGVITCAKKSFHPGKIVAGFLFGSKRLYEFAHNNPIIELHPTDYVNDPFNIAQNDNMVAINSAIQVDLTGQVCADSIGPRIFSGAGGQVDFIRGAARSKGGLPIIAFLATAKKGAVSRIVPMLNEGAGVVTTRNDVHYVVTEYGVASLYGKTIRQRAKELINIAHPKFREELTAAGNELGYL